MTGTELREMRRRAGLTQEGLARRAGVAVGTIARLEQGIGKSFHPFTERAVQTALEESLKGAGG